jgi:hypothetical protein
MSGKATCRAALQSRVDDESIIGATLLVIATVTLVVILVPHSKMDFTTCCDAAKQSGFRSASS